MGWQDFATRSRRSRVLVSSLALVTLGIAACHNVPPPPPPRDGFALTDKFFDIKSLGNNAFLLVGYRSMIARSEDGGSHWTRLTPPTKRNITRLGFADGKVGWGVGHEGIIFKTENAGDTWTEQKSGTKNALFEVAVTSPTNVWAVGDVSSVLHTTDGGANWSMQKVEISNIGLRDDMSLAVSDPIFYGISCIDDDTCWVTGEFGQIRFTKDGGKTWDAQHQDLIGPKYRDVMGLPTLLAVRGRDRQHAVAVGTYGAIVYTEDGAHWHFGDSPVSAPLYDIRALPDGNYLIVGASGIVLRGSPTSGWKLADLPPGIFTWMSAADFDTEGRGVAAGGHGLILRTSDFGKKWEWKANG